MHFTSTIIVAVGTLISAFWILSANSWMQTPQGYEVGIDNRLNPLNWLQIIFNPSFPFRYLHMVTAAYLSTAFIVGGVAGFYLLRGRHIAHARIMLGMATLMATFVAPLQLVIGDLHGLNTLQHQPAKIAAMEGIWETSRNVPLLLFALPDQAQKLNRYEVAIPHGASLFLTHTLDGEIKGLNAFAENVPPVPPVFFGFRIMVGLGMLMIFLGFASAWSYFRNRLFTARRLHQAWVIMMPSGLIALLAGWFVTEIGRQPYAVYGVIKTAQAVSPGILGPQVAWSLFSFVIIYTLIFGAGIYYMYAVIRKGIVVPEKEDLYYENSKGASVVESLPTKKGN